MSKLNYLSTLSINCICSYFDRFTDVENLSYTHNDIYYNIIGDRDQVIMFDLYKMYLDQGDIKYNKNIDYYHEAKIKYLLPFTRDENNMKVLYDNIKSMIDPLQFKSKEFADKIDIMISKLFIMKTKSTKSGHYINKFKGEKNKKASEKYMSSCESKYQCDCYLKRYKMKCELKYRNEVFGIKYCTKHYGYRDKVNKSIYKVKEYFHDDFHFIKTMINYNLNGQTYTNDGESLNIDIIDNFKAKVDKLSYINIGNDRGFKEMYQTILDMMHSKGWTHGTKLISRILEIYQMIKSYLEFKFKIKIEIPK